MEYLLYVQVLPRGTVKVSNDNQDYPRLQCQRSNLPEPMRDQLRMLSAADAGTKIKGFGSHTVAGNFLLYGWKLIANDDGIGIFRKKGETKYHISTQVVPNEEEIW